MHPPTDFSRLADSESVAFAVFFGSSPEGPDGWGTAEGQGRRKRKCKIAQDAASNRRALVEQRPT